MATLQEEEGADPVVEIFLHRRAQPLEVITVDEATSVEELAVECEAVGALVWLEDEEEPLNPTETLEAVGVVARCHVHVSLCPKVTVKVRYGGDTIERPVSPAATAGRLLKWAAGPEGFKLTDTEAAKHVLVICGTTSEFKQAEHVGFIADDDCSVCLDLLPKERFEG
ncbi:MAG: hypothetical protein OXS47_12265 [Chloroflexota bacterium]|nr:hypothetical protein [Chloroflexota bacterium]